MPQKFFHELGLKNKAIWSWTLYDWANSAFATTVMAVVLPIYFADVAAADLPEHLRTAYWGYTSAASIFFVAAFSPFLGTLVDLVPLKKVFLFFFMLVGSISCLGLYFVERGDWILAAVLYTLGTVGFTAGNAFYESLLPHICGEEEVDKVSAAGYAVGYLGGGVLLALHLAWISQPSFFGFSSSQNAVRCSLASVGFWWFFFSLPLFYYVSEPKITQKRSSAGIFKLALQTCQQLNDTVREISKYRYVVLFLLAFYFFSDGIGTVMKMSVIYGREMKIPQVHLIGAMLMVQFVGVPATFMFGKLARSIGSKLSISICLSVYCVVCVIGFFMQTAWHFWALAAIVALVQGGCQALSRSLFASIIPADRSGEFFGFYSISSKFAGILGPYLFGVLSTGAGQSRYSILMIIGFFLIGMVILWFLDIDEAKRQVAND